MLGGELKIETTDYCTDLDARWGTAETTDYWMGENAWWGMDELVMVCGEECLAGKKVCY